MARKHTRPSRRMLFTWFTLAGFILLFAPRSITNNFQFTFDRLFRWPLSIGRSFSLSATRSGHTDDHEETANFNYIKTLERRLEDAHVRIHELSGLRERFPFEHAELTPANITTAYNNQHSEFSINRGRIDGLRKGQFVLGQNAIIGTICDVGSHSAKVRLITDAESRIAVKIGQSNIHRIMRGTGDNLAKIKMIPKKYNVSSGDIVYVARQHKFLDNLVITGVITDCRIDNEDPSLWDITVKPAFQIDQLDSVHVIVMNNEK